MPQRSRCYGDRSIAKTRQLSQNTQAKSHTTLVKHLVCSQWEGEKFLTHTIVVFKRWVEIRILIGKYGEDLYT
jgi:hypothetical protein